MNAIIHWREVSVSFEGKEKQPFVRYVRRSDVEKYIYIKRRGGDL